MNDTIESSINEANLLINSPKYKKILCSVSGGADSDCVIDIISKVDKDNKVDYVYFNTGVEYKATREHIKYLEQKYNVKIEMITPKVPIPLAVKNHGQPFLSKQVSYNISQLQKYNFEWDNTDDYISLIKKYCKRSDKKIGNKCVQLSDGYWYKGCVGAILWWCNFSGRTEWGLERSGDAQFTIKRNRFLKDFLIQNPPTFTISSKCCDFAKKDVSHLLVRYRDYDLSILGVRKYEKGIRGAVYNCTFTQGAKCDNFYPLLFWTMEDRIEYEKENNIIHSKCYTEYGFSRTGCVCCPFGRELEQELKTTELYEPNLYKACNNIFKDSYEYTRKYNSFVKEQKLNEKIGKIR